MHSPLFNHRLVLVFKRDPIGKHKLENKEVVMYCSPTMLIPTHPPSAWRPLGSDIVWTPYISQTDTAIWYNSKWQYGISKTTPETRRWETCKVSFQDQKSITSGEVKKKKKKGKRIFYIEMKRWETVTEKVWNYLSVKDYCSSDNSLHAQSRDAYTALYKE